MSRKTKRTLYKMAVALALVAGGIVGSAIAQPEKATPRPTDQVTLGEEEARQLVYLMDKDKNGKVSKQEFSAFMDAEFKRLDTDQDGELDVYELMRSQMRMVPSFSSLGK